ncbi:MAG: type II toxin-antitoxin system RelE/ParE family toxin [Verrucomicrobia bacterium CG_4_10_14_3_um_filter_43_23]|nr:MAG: addiction module antitoxin RelB [Verrucomicrobia bacterium CG1_02_43_26]PIP59827.1 MAG: addiction module antitoxin RelB [Verrucomicrobia bacterium CG22_combo_CG10-13_8_21_14_all_43_17]PIX57839.1 MAG: type II toxin-antitoxin system RelE/ParE family toxin [Verrucomicrobia bacterium CG_4_10_14_3_um_filter_43_23]PIY63044.1 MAG: type II toxin-antitoxin system RelE/ParE family toxin [Verrucomicrobia bacterium CG_4_10_14_0_8_um_filter_43_34]PJA43708.1 MAG: type II toxin-antitoxin system RelE/P
MSGESNYTVEYLEAVLKEDIPRLGTSVRRLIKKAIEERLIIDPVFFGKPLRYSLQGHRRLCVSDYRVVYRIEPEEQLIVIAAIEHRKDVYEG